MNFRIDKDQNGHLRIPLSGLVSSILIFLVVAITSSLIAARVSLAVINEQIMFLRESDRRFEQEHTLLRTEVAKLREQLSAHRRLPIHPEADIRIRELERRLNKLD